MTENVKIRCSELPRVLKCPASLGAGVRIDEEGEAARIGSAVHECLAKTITGEGDVSWESIARAWHVEPDQVTPLAGAGMKAWNKLDITPVAVEEYLQAEVAEDITLAGHADIIGDHESAGRLIVDWKTGSSTNSYRDQLIGYALLALRHDIGAREGELIPIVVVWLREGVIDTEFITSKEIGDLVEKLNGISSKTDQYSAGQHCLYCPRRHDCDAREANLRADVKALTEAKCESLTVSELAGLKPKADALKKVIKSYEDLLKLRLAESGPVELEDGREVALVKSERDKIVNVESAIAVCQAYHDLKISDMAPAMSISKSKLLKIVGDRAERGQKGAVRDKLMDDIRETGAVETTEVQSVKIRRSQKSLESGGGK